MPCWDTVNNSIENARPGICWFLCINIFPHTTGGKRFGRPHCRSQIVWVLAFWRLESLFAPLGNLAIRCDRVWSKPIQRATSLGAVWPRVRLTSESKLYNFISSNQTFASCFWTSSPWRLNGWGCLHIFRHLRRTAKRPASGSPVCCGKCHSRRMFFDHLSVESIRSSMMMHDE